MAELLTTKQMASVLKITAKTFRKWVIEHNAPFYGSPNCLRFKKDEIFECLTVDLYRNNDTPLIAEKSGYVYLMVDSQTGFHKIGYSKNPKVRESTLFSEKPSIELLGAWEGSFSDERELHEKFATTRIRGEWFDLNEIDVEAIYKRFRRRKKFEVENDK